MLLLLLLLLSCVLDDASELCCVVGSPKTQAHPPFRFSVCSTHSPVVALQQPSPKRNGHIVQRSLLKERVLQRGRQVWTGCRFLETGFFPRLVIGMLYFNSRRKCATPLFKRDETGLCLMDNEIPLFVPYAT